MIRQEWYGSMALATLPPELEQLLQSDEQNLKTVGQVQFLSTIGICFYGSHEFRGGSLYLVGSHCACPQHADMARRRVPLRDILDDAKTWPLMIERLPTDRTIPYKEEPSYPSPQPSDSGKEGL